MSAELTIEYQSIDDLLTRQFPQNPKEHNIDQLRASMQEHGFIEPIVQDGRTGFILGGHGRLETLIAMRDMSASPPTHVRADIEGPSWFAPVSVGWSSEDDDEARRANVRLNRLSEMGGWNVERLVEFPVADLLDDLWTPEEIENLFEGNEDLLDARGTDARHADLPPPRKGEPPPPRVAQGMKEIVMQLQVPQWEEAEECLAILKRRWHERVPGLVMLRALREAAKATEEIKA